MVDGYSTTSIEGSHVFKVPGNRDMGARGITEVHIEYDKFVEMIAVYNDQDEWLGKIAAEQWSRWTDAERVGVLQDMLTWPPCNRGDGPVEPNEQGVLERLAALCRTVVTS